MSQGIRGGWGELELINKVAVASVCFIFTAMVMVGIYLNNIVEASTSVELASRQEFRQQHFKIHTEVDYLYHEESSTCLAEFTYFSDEVNGLGKRNILERYRVAVDCAKVCQHLAASAREKAGCAK